MHRRLAKPEARTDNDMVCGEKLGADSVTMQWVAKQRPTGVEGGTRTEIDELGVAVLVYNHVLWLQVTVHYLEVVEVVECQNLWISGQWCSMSECCHSSLSHQICFESKIAVGVLPLEQ